MWHCSIQKIPLLLIACWAMSLAWPLWASQAAREIAVIIDTSGSMESSDTPRYTVQISKILAELVNPQDTLTIIGMSDNSTCSLGADQSLALSFTGANIEAFKQQVDARIQYTTGTHFAVAIKTALQVLSFDADKKRMLIIIADSSGLDCINSFNDLQNLHQSGAMVAAINLGSHTGAFDKSPAFDFTAAALNSEQLIKAVAQVYQQFIGGKRVQTGQVMPNIQFDLPAFVSEAFLVIAADGVIHSVTPKSGNPAADMIVLQHGQGQTVGLEGRSRTYQIIRLDQPAAGTWQFTVPQLKASAGWMLIQATAIGVRFVKPPTLVKGILTPLEIELYDQATGQRITETPPGLTLNVTVNGQTIEFTDDGQNYDKNANDGILTGALALNHSGKQQVAVQVETDFINQTTQLEIAVIESAWKLKTFSPQQTELDIPTPLQVSLTAIGDTSQLSVPQRIIVMIEHERIVLQDTGTAGDAHANDQNYAGVWHPSVMGTNTLTYAAEGHSILPVTEVVEVLGKLAFGAPIPIHFGETQGNNPGLPALFDLNNTTIKGAYDITLSSDFKAWDSVLEIKLGNEWLELSSTPIDLRLEQHGNKTWPVRMRTGRCPAARSDAEPFTITATTIDAAGKTVQLFTPAHVTIHATPWLTCWLPILSLVTAIALGLFILYGFTAPARFSRRLGVFISPEVDINEGFFHPIRATRGTGSGFYRDARVYICENYRLSASSKEGFVCLRAEGKRVKILPMRGSHVWRKTVEDEWEQLPQQETAVRKAVLYKNDSGTLFFEIRNG